MGRIVASCFAVLALSACATVSMVPAQTVVETEIRKEQTALRDISATYTQMAEANGWVTKSTGLLGLARILVDGINKDAKTPATYADRIEAESGATATVYLQLREDIGAATTGLEAVVKEADALLAQTELDASALRADVISLEGALVTAQKSRRTFAKALNIVSMRAPDGASVVDADLEAFDMQIDRARDAADALADKYAAAPDAKTVS